MSRAEAMKPCPIGHIGQCCKHCHMGPCRLVKPGQRGVCGATLETAAHAGNGTAWCQLAGPLSPMEFELCAEWMRLHTRARGGWLVVEALPAGLLGRFDPWGFHQNTLPLMRRVKNALDPAGLFAPGRFVGGI